MPADVHGKAIAIAGLAIAATVIGVMLGVLLLLRLWQVAPGADRLDAGAAVLPPQPTLQSAPQRDLAAQRAGQARRLQAAEWLDAQHQRARIPIEDAMALLAASAPRRAGSAP
jgi:hypothetical protein